MVAISSLRVSLAFKSEASRSSKGIPEFAFLKGAASWQIAVVCL